MHIINLIIWIFLCFVLCWCLRERHLLHCYIKKKNNIKPKNTEVLIYNIKRFPWSLKPICYLRKIIKNFSYIFSESKEKSPDEHEDVTRAVL